LLSEGHFPPGSKGHKIEAIASVSRNRATIAVSPRVRMPRGVGEWKAGTVSQLLARLPG
jgi:hypothetical protein